MKYQLSFCRHKNMISSHEKITLHVIFTREISLLLWLHNKSRLSQQTTISVKWFGILCWKKLIFHLFAALACEISWLSTLKEKFCIMISAQPKYDPAEISIIYFETSRWRQQHYWFINSCHPLFPTLFFFIKFLKLGQMNGHHDGQNVAMATWWGWPLNRG